MKLLVIAEKPNLAKSIISAIGYEKFNWEEGYAEGPRYIVTWSFGHLFSLADLDRYLPCDRNEKKNWSLTGLPFCPNNFLYELKPDAGIKKQFQTIKKLVDRPDVEGIIHAGDADREGEIIIRTILDKANNKAPVYRLWLPAQTAEDIREGLRNMKPDQAYDNLAREGYARTMVDWLYGINLTRTASVQCGSLIRVGRVIVPIVKAIYDRDAEIRNFKPRPFFAVVGTAQSGTETIKLTCKQTFDADDRAGAHALAELLNSQRAVVTDITREEKTVSAGKLLNQDSLQACAGKKYKMAPQETLDIAQKLYDNGYITYPRTSSEYLALSEQEKTNRVINLLRIKGYNICPKNGSKAIYNDSKVEKGGHSAITPTHKLPEQGDLSTREQQIYDLILNRFLAVFCSEACKAACTVITIMVGDTPFSLQGSVYLQRGWMEYESVSHADKTLPALCVGDQLKVFFQPVRKETKPPSHYTVETLGHFLQNPFSQEIRKGEHDCLETDAPAMSPESELPDDDADYKAMLSGLEIGTVATRAGIIKKAIDSNYISLRNNKYTILPDGVYYIETLWKLGITMDKFKTAHLGQTLKKVYHNELTVRDCIDQAMVEIKAFYDRAACFDPATLGKEALTPNALCKCPLCGHDIREGKKSYYCSNYKNCNLAGIWKKTYSVNITQKDAVALFKGSTITKTHKTQHGKTTFKKLRYDLNSGEVLNVTNEPMTVGQPDSHNDAFLTCPVCKSCILERATSFSCSNRDCSFVLWKDSRYYGSPIHITPAKAKALLSGKHALFTLRNKKGKEYKGYLKLVVSGSFANFEVDGFPRNTGHTQ